VPSLHDGRTDRRFFAEYPATTGEPETIDTDEVVAAIAKTVAELTCGQDGTIRQQLMREIMNYDAEFRRDAGIGAIGSGGDRVKVRIARKDCGGE
jgi:hypothetical protein